MKTVAKYLALWLVLGMFYAQLELFFRGVTYLPMTFIGGAAGLLIGLLNRHPAYYNRTMWQLCVLGTLIILSIEYLTGYIFNIRLKMNLWDYSANPCNYRGQICIKLAVAWFFLVPLAVWADAMLRWKLFGESHPDSLWHHYKRLLTFR